jgi:predicted RNA-binding Zn-ribbon protein involved in translation (DUF1610 family)
MPVEVSLSEENKQLLVDVAVEVIAAAGLPLPKELVRRVLRAAVALVDEVDFAALAGMLNELPIPPPTPIIRKIWKTFVARAENDDTEYEVECPSSGDVIQLGEGAGTYECPNCGMEIEVDDDGAEHPVLPEVTCPESGDTITLGDDGAYDCPDCDQAIEVEGGVAYHPMLVECPVSREEVWVKAEEDTYKCPECGLSIEVADDEAVHATPRRPGPRTPSRRRAVAK